MLSVASFRQYQGMNWYEERKESGGKALFAVVTYGTCIYWVDGDKTIVQRGDFLLIPAGSVYYGKSVPTVFHEQYVLEFTVEAGMEQALPLLGADSAIRSRAGCYELSLERLRTVWKEWNDSLPYAELRAAAFLLDTLSLWSREYERGEESDISLRHADNMKAYIQAHYRTRITKEHLGECIGRSPNHAATLFRRVTGQTISHYVHALRMRTAVYMLTESLLSVAEISEYLGYDDVSYFQRIFKRTAGFTPSHYLKERPIQV